MINIYDFAKVLKAMKKTEFEKLVKTLNPHQIKTYKSLIRLGDSEELALATVWNLKNTIK